MFNFFKKPRKVSTASPAFPHYEVAREKLEEQAHSAALNAVIKGLRADVYYGPLYELAADCLEQMGGTEESGLFRAAGSRLDRATFRNLGVHFYQVGHYALSRLFLEEAIKLKQDAEVADLLAIVYARRFDTKRAQSTLESVREQLDFWGYWFFVKLRILNDDRKGLKEQLDRLTASLTSDEDDEEGAVPREKVTELREAYERLLLLERPEQNIRDWHFIQYGGVILDFFETDEYVAGGRYVATWGNQSSIKSILLQLARFMTGKHYERIVHANSRDAKILGLTLGQLTGLPVLELDTNRQYTDSILLGATADELGEFLDVTRLSNRNLTFALSLNWLEPHYVCPDVTGLLAQSFSFPWGGDGFRIDADGQSERIPADDRPATEIAADLAATEVEEPTSIDPLYERVAPLLKANATAGHRYNFAVESPVPGSFFGTH